MTGREQMALTMLLALPAILAQLSMCLMSCIDAAMVGRLGSAPAAAVGLVSSSTWIFGSFCYGNTSGFSVQLAHRCGAKDFDGARSVFRKGLACVLGISLLLALAAAGISGSLPLWLGGSEEIHSDASSYFLIYALFLPVFQLAVYSEGCLIASGNLKVPSLASLAMCVLDVLFNWFFIFVMDMGAKGAALGTGLAELCTGAFLLSYVLTRSVELRHQGSLLLPARRIMGFRSVRVAMATVKERASMARGGVVGQAFRIAWPLWLQNLVTRGAYICATLLIAPLGTVAIAANSFAIIAEGFCYLPGYGMQDAASTLVGQSLGAGRSKLARRFSFITIASGAGMMACLAVLMYVFAEPVMALLSQDPEVIALGASCLRIEAWAELLFGVSIVAGGCCVGAGDTLFPSMLNLVSMWVVRIGLALLLIPRMGLRGYWVAMAVELSFKGLVFIVRMKGNRWMKARPVI